MPGPNNEFWVEVFSRVGIFLGASGPEVMGEDLSRFSAFILGAPMDWTVSYRPGTRFGPEEIRRVSSSLELYSPVLDQELTGIDICDLGDLALPFGRVEESLELISRVSSELCRRGKFFILLGGEHLVSYPAIKEVAAVYPDLKVIHFDAHADLRDEYSGARLSHATVMRRVSEIIAPYGLYQIGIRSGTREEFNFAREFTRFFGLDWESGVNACLDEIGNSPVYISLDIDVFDPAFAPGTGTPEPGGLTVREMFEVLYRLRPLNVVAMDVVEVASTYDPSGRTALLAAKIIREALLMWGGRGR